MASIKNSLRKIYTALGGTNTKSKTITGLLDDISTVASGGGSDSLIVNFVDGAASERYVADKTRSEILEALNNGQVIIAIYNTSDVNFRGLIYQAMGEFTVQFNSIWGFYSRDGQMQSQYEWWKKA